MWIERDILCAIAAATLHLHTTRERDEEKVQKMCRDMNHHNTARRLIHAERDMCSCLYIGFLFFTQPKCRCRRRCRWCCQPAARAAIALNLDGDGRLFNHFVVRRECQWIWIGATKRKTRKESEREMWRVGECISCLARSSLCMTHRAQR